MQFESNPDISADGNYVAFESSTNLTDEQIFVFDRVQQTYTDISASLGGSARGPSISGDGNYVVFTDVVNGENHLGEDAGVVVNEETEIGTWAINV